MNLSGLIEILTNLKDTHGDLMVCRTESHEYWGTLYYEIQKDEVVFTENAKPDGPKRGTQTAIVIQSTY